MGCGGSKINAVDAESIDERDTEPQGPENGIKASIREETDAKTVQFSSNIDSNGIASNEGKIYFDFVKETFMIVF